MDTKSMSRRIRELMANGMTRQQALATIIAEAQLAARERFERRKEKCLLRQRRTRT